MASRPILFSGPMVRAILGGRKTQTRRTLRGTPSLTGQPEQVDGQTPHICGDSGWHFRRGDGRCEWHIACPYGQPGDKLWVRETWGARDIRGCSAPRIADIDTVNDRVEYRADGMPDDGRHWFPSIHMPRWASRLTLEVTAVRVERLQAITEEDAIAEGVDAVPVADVPRQGTLCRRDDFAQLWDLINGKRAPWSSNPWVWVVNFRRLP